MADTTLTDPDLDQDPYAWPVAAIVVPPPVPPVNRSAIARGFLTWLAMLVTTWLGVAGGIVLAVLILRAVIR